MTKQPARVGDIELPEGANVLLLLGSANHDDTVFADPDAIDLQRENARTTSPSATASTSASARRWRGWRRRSCSRS